MLQNVVADFFKLTRKSLSNDSNWAHHGDAYLWPQHSEGGRRKIKRTRFTGFMSQKTTTKQVKPKTKNKEESVRNPFGGLCLLSYMSNFIKY